MAFDNAKEILRRVSGATAFQLLLLVAKASRPQIAPLCNAMLRPFRRREGYLLHYHQGQRGLQALIRNAEESSDLHSVMEVVIRNVYPLDTRFVPDLVVDGGGNIGLFTMQAAATYPAARVIVCEPVPHNLTHLRRQLEMNRITAQIEPVCLGGARGLISFYCRGANSGSSDADKPYNSKIEVDVLPMREILAGRPAERLLIKLDIEGMELDVLEDYVPGEEREVVVVGELHQHRRMRPRLEALLKEYGWSLRLGDDLSGEDAQFVAHSPAAQRFTVQ